MIEKLSDYFICFIIRSGSLIKSHKIIVKFILYWDSLHSEYPVTVYLIIFLELIGINLGTTVR